jgi:hypothetical protein
MGRGGVLIVSDLECWLSPEVVVCGCVGKGLGKQMEGGFITGQAPGGRVTTYHVLYMYCEDKVNPVNYPTMDRSDKYRSHAVRRAFLLPWALQQRGACRCHIELEGTLSQQI